MQQVLSDSLARVLLALMRKRVVYLTWIMRDDFRQKSGYCDEFRNLLLASSSFDMQHK